MKKTMQKKGFRKKVAKKAASRKRAQKKGAQKESLMSKDQVAVILEHMDEKFDYLVEAQKITDQKVDHLNEKVDVLTERVDILDGKVGMLDQKVSSLNQNFTQFKQETRDNFTAVFTYLSRIDEEIKDIRKELEQLKKNGGSKKEIHALDIRITHVEKQQAALLRMQKSTHSKEV